MTQINTPPILFTFTLHAPEAQEVFLAGSFNKWNTSDLPMKQDESGTWKVAVNLEPGVYEYRFIVNGGWQNDPNCKECCDNAFGTSNSLVRI